MFKGFSLLDWALFIAMGATAIILFLGLFIMVKGGETNKRYGNKLMRWRVIMQGIALGLFALVLIFKSS